LFLLPACVNLGLVSEQIHTYGRFAENYASLQYKNALGLLLVAVIVSLLVCLFHLFLPLGSTHPPFYLKTSFINVLHLFRNFLTVLVFFSLCLAVFFGTVAGIFRTATPFRGTSCGAPVDSFPEKWQPYVHECSRIVTMQGISWSLCKFSPVHLNLYVSPPRPILQDVLWLIIIAFGSQGHYTFSLSSGRWLTCSGSPRNRHREVITVLRPAPKCRPGAQHDFILETVFVSFFFPVCSPHLSGCSGSKIHPLIPHAPF